MRPASVALLVAAALLTGACTPQQDTPSNRLAALEKDVAQLRAQLSRQAGVASNAAVGHAEGPELGAQMLELQVRHARLWQAGAARNWMLAQFQLAELRESVADIVRTNGDHAALQPQRLADVMPAMLDPALAAMQSALDAQDGAALDAAYDQLSNACTACHAASGHGFLVIQRPRAPVLDNLRAEPASPGTP